MIAKTKQAVYDMLIASAFITMGVLLPGSLLDRGFEAHIGGIALGLGIGWLLKSYIQHSKGVQP